MDDVFLCIEVTRLVYMEASHILYLFFFDTCVFEKPSISSRELVKSLSEVMSVMYRLFDFEHLQFVIFQKLCFAVNMAFWPLKKASQKVKNSLFEETKS